MDRNGFDEFVTHSLPALGRYGYVLTGNSHDAADLVQDALVRVFRAWHPVRQDGNPLAYGEKVVFQAAGTSVLVVIEPSTMPGLPGQSVDVPWPVGPGSPQFYLNATSDATFLTAWTPAGATWFIAVNGGEAATRLATVSPIAQASIK